MENKPVTRRSVLLFGAGLLLAGSAYPLLGAAGFGKSGGEDALKRVRKTAPKEPVPVKMPPGREVATLAGGCFWSMQAMFELLKGVDKVVAGYAGGDVARPSYEAVCSGDTGHTETIDVVFNPAVISYADLLRVYFTAHDPTTLNRQGNDAGTQYRSAVFYHNTAQKNTAQKVIAELNAKKAFASPIVTEVSPFRNFYAAEAYHQDYFAHNPNQGYCAYVVAPEVKKFRELNRARLK